MYNNIALAADVPAACAEYITEIYGIDVLNAFPPAPSILWDCIMAGLTESQAQLDLYMFYRLVPLGGLLP